VGHRGRRRRAGRRRDRLGLCPAVSAAARVGLSCASEKSTWRCERGSHRDCWSPLAGAAPGTAGLGPSDSGRHARIRVMASCRSSSGAVMLASGRASFCARRIVEQTVGRACPRWESDAPTDARGSARTLGIPDGPSPACLMLPPDRERTTQGDECRSAGGRSRRCIRGS
jgi:hypothetical protein